VTQHALLDEIWFHETTEAVRVERLVARHVAYGRGCRPRHAVVAKGLGAGVAR
jgi:hypothetical protein